MVEKQDLIRKDAVSELDLIVGQKIRELRTYYNLSLRQLGQLANLSHQHISNVENGLRSCSIKDLEKICQALEISVLELYNQINLPEKDTNQPESYHRLILLAKKLDKSELDLIEKLVQKIVGNKFSKNIITWQIYKELIEQLINDEEV